MRIEHVLFSTNVYTKNFGKLSKIDQKIIGCKNGWHETFKDILYTFRQPSFNDILYTFRQSPMGGFSNVFTLFTNDDTVLASIFRKFVNSGVKLTIGD